MGTTLLPIRPDLLLPPPLPPEHTRRSQDGELLAPAISSLDEKRAQDRKRSYNEGPGAAERQVLAKRVAAAAVCGALERRGEQEAAERQAAAARERLGEHEAAERQGAAALAAAAAMRGALGRAEQEAQVERAQVQEQQAQVQWLFCARPASGSGGYGRFHALQTSVAVLR